MNTKKRGRFLLRFISVLMTLALLTGLVPASMLTAAFAADTEEVLFASISDIHYFAKESMGSKSEELLKEMTQADNQILQLESLLDSALEAVKALKEEKGLKYLLLPGDLTYNGEKAGHTELAAILEAFEKDSGVKVFVINGNHDINEGKATTYENDIKERAAATSPEEFKQIYSKLVYGLDGVELYTPPQYKMAGSLSYAISLDGYRLIAIDAGKYSFDATASGFNGAETAGNISDDLMEWVETQAAQAKANGETVIAMCHWNVVEMNYVQKNVLQGFVVDNMEQTADTLADAGVHFLFTGHSHSSDIAYSYSDKGEVIYDIQTAALSTFPNTFRVTGFTKNADKSVTASFDVYDADYAKPISDGTTVYTAPYREASFGIARSNGNAAEFVMTMLSGYLDTLFADINTGGGLLKYIEKQADIQIEDTIRTYLFMDITIPGTDFTVLSANNIMNFIYDLEDQIQSKFIDDPQYTYGLINDAVDRLLNLQVSDYPCDKFVDLYGFGSKTEPGTLGDAVFSCLVYMYEGNEDISNDAFMNDVIDKSYSGELVEQIVDLLVQILVYEIVQDEFLSQIKLNIPKLFPEIGTYVEMALKLFLGNDLSYLNVINKLLGLIDFRYGSNIDEIFTNLFETYITDSQYEGIGYQIGSVIEGCCTDDSLDHDVEYTYSGPVEIVPTSADYRLPSAVSLVFGSDPKTSFNFSWYTKYSVTGTDIEIKKAVDGVAPLFSGKATTGDNIVAKTTPVDMYYPGVDIGIIGFFPYELKLVRHTIKLTGLEAGEKYYFKIGDASKGWWSEMGLLQTSENDGSFRFMYVSDTQSQSPEQYSGTWGNLTAQAFEKFDDFEFIVHGGDFVDHGDNANQWQWCLDSAQAQLLSTPLVPTAGNHEAFGTNALNNYFALEDYPEQDTSGGVYYSFEYENTYFAILNSNDLSSKNALSDAQIKWLKEDSAKSNAVWKIVVIHKPAYTNGSHIADDDVIAIREQMSTLMPQLGIDLVLQGHDHVYVRTDVLKDGKATWYTKSVALVDDKPVETKVNADGTVYVIAGKAGIKNYPEVEQSIIDLYVPSLIDKTVNTTLPVFASVRVTNDVLFLEAYTVDGENLKRIDVFGLENKSVELLLGDVNLNNKLEIADARLILRHAVGIDVLNSTKLQLADIDFNGEVKIADARMALRAAVGIEPLKTQYVRVYTDNPAFYQ